MRFTSSLKLKLIYVFRINDVAHSGCLKIGEATCEDENVFGLSFNRTEQTWFHSHTFSATVRNNTFQSVHLPYIPGDNIGYMVDGFNLRIFTELVPVIFDER